MGVVLQMRIDLKRSICLGVMAAAFIPASTSWAIYKSSSGDTGIERLDYIENQKRLANSVCNGE